MTSHANTTHSQNTEQEVLKQFTKNLTELAEKGKLDPVIGRDKEIRRVIQVLSRRKKNNPVLIGEPGVGKTAIAEGLAVRIINKDVPDILLGKTLLSLDLASMVAGSVYRGQFEERLKTLVRAIESSQGQIILFIDEIHTLVGAGKIDGAMDAGQILKPSLARGEMRAIGATTMEEYRKFIEKDAALERRFQTILVEEPSIEDALTILRGLKEKYEVHHGVRIKDSALIQAVKLSHRYITDRYLPDKAIDLMDEAASQLSLEVNSVPIEVDEIRRKILQLKVEKKALEKEKDHPSKKRLKEVDKEIQALQVQNQKLTDLWEKERSQRTSSKQLKIEIEDLKIQIDRAQREGQLDKAAELKYLHLPKKNQQLAELEKQTIEHNKNTLLKEEVGANEVAEVVSKWTGIPVQKMLQEQAQKLLNMEDEMRKQVIGQDEALNKISDAVRRSRSGIADPDRPIGVFMFLGPTGVGKTETAKSLANFLFDSEKKMIRLDMSEYAEKHQAERMIGAPPGYVGYEDGGQLTEYVRRHPYSVVLLDEIEKAHIDVFNILLQVFDDGRLTDGQGRTVDFTNCIFIMTSNIGSSNLLEHPNKEHREKVILQLRQKFRPEFLNRVDDFIFFNPLEKKELNQIINIQLKQIQSRLNEKNIELDIQPPVIDYLIKKGYDPAFGARPLKRAIQSELLNPLSRKIISGDVVENSKVLIKKNDLALEFHMKTLQSA